MGATSGMGEYSDPYPRTNSPFPAMRGSCVTLPVRPLQSASKSTAGAARPSVETPLLGVAGPATLTATPVGAATAA